MVGHAVTCWYMTCGSWISERLHPNYGWYIAMFPPHTVVYCRWWNMVNLANHHVWIIPAHVLIQSFTALTPLQPQIQRWSQGQHQSLASAQSQRLVLTGHTHVGWPWEWTGSVSKFQDPNVWVSLRWIYIFSLSEAVQFPALALLFFRTPFPRVQKGLKNTARMSDIRYFTLTHPHPCRTCHWVRIAAPESNESKKETLSWRNRLLSHKVQPRIWTKCSVPLWSFASFLLFLFGFSW